MVFKNKLKTNPTKFVKIPYLALKKAQEKGIQKQFLFYCTVKTINIEGFLKRGEVVNSIQKKTALSEASIRLKLNQLESLGWLKRETCGVLLSKYDVIWSSLGIVKKSKDGQKIFKIKSGNFEEIELTIRAEEIKYCLFKQYFRVSTSFCQESGYEDTGRKPSVRAKLRKKLLNQTDFSKLFLLQVKNILITSPKTNYDVALSCRGTAKLFGYKSAMQGHLIQKRLQKEGYIRVENRIVCVGQKEQVNGKLPFGCFISSNGKVYKQLPNKITFKVY